MLIVKNKWAVDTLRSFFGNISYVLGDFDNPECERANTFCDLVSISLRPKKLSQPLQLSLPGNLVQQIKIAEQKVQKFLPGEEGVRSAIIRQAIRWHFEDKQQKGLKTRMNNDFLRMAAQRGERIK